MNEKTVAEVYCAVYNDLVMGTAVCVAYVKAAKAVAVFGRYLESASINYANLVAINLGFERVPTDYPYSIHTNSKYATQVILNCQKWRNQNIVEQKAHPEQVNQILNHIERLGTGEVNVEPYRGCKDELMIRAYKHAKHFYYLAQVEMIKYQTTALRPNCFPDSGILHLDELPGSVIWKTPLSMSVFEKKMTTSRVNSKSSFLKLIPGGIIE